MFIIGIDIGTTNVKVCLFELPSFELAEHYRFATPVHSEAGFASFDVEQIWSGILAGIRQVAAYANLHGDSIHGISVASVGQSVVLIDRRGQAIGPVIAWYDKITERQAEWIRESVGAKKLYGITGIPSHSNHSLAKLLWLAEHYPKEIARTKRWLCLSDYVVYRLTGEMKTEFSLASRTLAYDIANRKWSEDILQKFRLDPSLFPEVAESGSAIGTVRSTLAKELGLAPATPVANAGHDHIVGSYCAGLEERREILNSTGTTEGLLITMKRPRMDGRFMARDLSNGLYVTPPLYTLYGSMPTAGFAVEWFRRLFLKDDEEWMGLTADLQRSYGRNPHELFARLSAFVPHLRGSGPPERRLHAKALIYGLTESSSKSDILYSVLSGLCFELKGLFDIFAERTGVPYRLMKVVGPATRNPLWLQLKADILGCEVHSLQIEETVAKGAAMLSAVKQGLFEHAAAIPLRHRAKVFEPNAEISSQYGEYFKERYLPLKKLKSQLE